MSCARACRLLDAWLDNELDAATREDMARHFAGCLSCDARRSDRVELRKTIRAAAAHHNAPPAFAEALRQRLASTHGTTTSQRPSRHRPSPAQPFWQRPWLRQPPWQRPSWWTVTALACGAACVGAFAMFAWLRAPALGGGQYAAVDRHVAALAVAKGRAERLVDVGASDRHVVKPWFQGKVEFSPPVRDLASEGFSLLGARLDRIDGQRAAVVVYRIRNHPIDLFVWRANRAPSPLQLLAERGFNVVTWADQGLEFAAVSDVDSRDLERFAKVMQAQPPRP